jgi:hypothetical protein
MDLLFKQMVQAARQHDKVAIKGLLKTVCIDIRNPLNSTPAGWLAYQGDEDSAQWLHTQFRASPHDIAEGFARAGNLAKAYEWFEVHHVHPIFIARGLAFAGPKHSEDLKSWWQRHKSALAPYGRHANQLVVAAVLGRHLGYAKQLAEKRPHEHTAQFRWLEEIYQAAAQLGESDYLAKVQATFYKPGTDPDQETVGLGQHIAYGLGISGQVSYSRTWLQAQPPWLSGVLEIWLLDGAVIGRQAALYQTLLEEADPKGLNTYELTKWAAYSGDKQCVEEISSRKETASWQDEPAFWQVKLQGALEGGHLVYLEDLYAQTGLLPEVCSLDSTPFNLFLQCWDTTSAWKLLRMIRPWALRARLLDYLTRHQAVWGAEVAKAVAAHFTNDLNAIEQKYQVDDTTAMAWLQSRSLKIWALQGAPQLIQREILNLDIASNIARFCFQPPLACKNAGQLSEIALHRNKVKVASLNSRGTLMERQCSVYVPETSVTSFRQALIKAGAQVTASVPGTGQFFAGKGSQPAIGKPGQLSTVPESRIDIHFAEAQLAETMLAIKGSHPYETPNVIFIFWPGTERVIQVSGKALSIGNDQDEWDRRFLRVYMPPAYFKAAKEGEVAEEVEEVKAVKKTLFAAGAGTLGHYTQCAWQSTGSETSSFFQQESRPPGTEDMHVLETVYRSDVIEEVKQALKIIDETYHLNYRTGYFLDFSYLVQAIRQAQAEVPALSGTTSSNFFTPSPSGDLAPNAPSHNPRPS